MLNTKKKTRKMRVGIVVSDKMQKTVTVLCQRRFPHPKYRKIITRSLKVMAHDEKNSAKVGDKVSILETRPLSKRKRWYVLEILEKAK